MSTSWSASSRNCVAVAGLPLIQARLLPWLSMLRRSSRLSSASKPASSSQGAQRGRQVELGADVGAGRAFAHHAGVGAGAQRQLQRVDEDGLARAGFAGEHAEAAGQVELELAHDHEVAQGDALQASCQYLPSFQCSFLRSVSK